MLPGQAGEIASLVMEDAKALQKLLAMNLMPGVPISLLRRSPSFVLESGFSQFAVDEEIAKLIQVRIAPVPRSGMN
jgi:Fe2+ transport system protein FeoA